MSYSVYGFWASKRPHECEEYLDGHVKVLEEFGITNVTTNSDYWKERDDVYVFICREIESGQVVAGIRVEPKVDFRLLPIESALLPMDQSVSSIIELYRQGGEVAEVCGLWNSRKVFGRDISRFMSECAIASLNYLKIQSAFCLVAHYTLELSESLGFQVVREIGKDGWVPYPNETYKAYSMVIPEIDNLDSGNREVVKRILGMRIAPVGSTRLVTPRYVTDIDYNLF